MKTLKTVLPNIFSISINENPPILREIINTGVDSLPAEKISKQLSKKRFLSRFKNAIKNWSQTRMQIITCDFRAGNKRYSR